MSLNILLGLSGCAISPHAKHASVTNDDIWQGNISVRLEPTQHKNVVTASTISPPSVFTSAFTLSGSPVRGELQFDGVLGITLAQIHWSPTGAALIHIGQSGSGAPQNFPDLPSLLKTITGIVLPIEALFDWLQGIPIAVPGWDISLNQFASDGIIIARRAEPAFTVYLHIVLDRS